MLKYLGYIGAWTKQKEAKRRGRMPQAKKARKCNSNDTPVKKGHLEKMTTRNKAWENSM